MRTKLTNQISNKIKRNLNNSNKNINKILPKKKDNKNRLLIHKKSNNNWTNNKILTIIQKIIYNFKIIQLLIHMTTRILIINKIIIY